MSAELKTDLQLEIAHVLCTDIVGYSKLLVNEQSELVRQLNQVVRHTEQFRKAEAAGKLIRIPTGDGMALAFFTSPDAPVRCAVEIAKALREFPRLRLRMGIHSGPVDQVRDVNNQLNVAGTGINNAQRVMDCGDAGHILLTKRAAEDLGQYGQWQSHLHDLGEVEVKHGVRLNVVNFYTDDVGNPNTPERIRREAAAVRRKRRKLAILIASALAIAGLSSLFFIQRISAIKLQKSIAVLPFENRSDDKANDYFADGVQDDILIDLAKVADLKVISRRSVAQYRGSTKDIRDIGKALGVAYVLEGSVRKAGDMIHVTAELIDTRSEAQTWADKFDRRLADIFAIQSEIAQTIVTRLKAALTPAEKVSIEQRPTRDMEAYDLYLRAKQLVRNSITPMEDPNAGEKIDQAIALLDKAVARDPDFALAYCLAVEGNLLNFWAIHGLQEPIYRDRAEAALQKVLKLAPDAGETHLAHATFYYYGNRDYDHALEELEIAARLLPNDTDVLSLSAKLERRLGRWSEAARHFAKAIELDPRNTQTRVETCRTYTMMRRYKEAIELADRSITDFPEAANAFRVQKGQAALKTGDTKTARATLEPIPLSDRNTIAVFLLWFYTAMYDRNFDEAKRAIASRLQLPHREQLAPDTFFEGDVARAQGNVEKATAAYLDARKGYETRIHDHPEDAGYISLAATVDAALGNKEEALRETQKALEMNQDPLERPNLLIDQASVYNRLGERERTLQLLEELAKVPHGIDYGTLRLDPEWDSLRGDPRFEKILESLKPK